jgi:hypothetical protein
MAELTRADGGRVGIQSGGGAVTPGINFQPADVSTGYREQARMQNTAAQTIDRLTSVIFGQAEKTSQQAGLQFAAENPLTRDQLDAMVKGDMSKVNLGSPLNVFDSALRKARAFELSAHSEAEATSKFLDLYQRAERGEIDFEAVKNGVKSVSDGYSSALAQVDPESSFKFRASMANMGNKVIDETAKLEQKKRMLSNGLKVQRGYQDFLRIAELYVSGDMPIDETTGEPFNKDTVVDMLATNFLNNAITMVGVNGAAQYQAQILKDLTDVKVNALSKYIAEEFGDEPLNFQRLRQGDAGRLTDVWQTLGIEGQAKVMNSYFTKISTDNNIKDQVDKANLVERQMKTVDLLSRAQGMGDGPMKRDLIRQIAELRVVPFNDIEKLATGGGESSSTALFNAETMIYDGRITSSDQIFKLTGVSSKDKLDLQRKFFTRSDKTNQDMNKALRYRAGIPDGLVNLNPKDAEYGKLLNLQQKVEDIKQDAAAKGEVLTNSQILEKIDTDIAKERSAASVESAKNSLKVYDDIVGVEITSKNIDALEIKIRDGKYKKIRKEQIETIKKLVRQKEGTQ